MWFMISIIDFYLFIFRILYMYIIKYISIFFILFFIYYNVRGPELTLLPSKVPRFPRKAVSQGLPKSFQANNVGCGSDLSQTGKLFQSP
jgi:hypothetical protein